MKFTDGQITKPEPFYFSKPGPPDEFPDTMIFKVRPWYPQWLIKLWMRYAIWKVNRKITKNIKEIGKQKIVVSP
jgi:hypothetical protein